MKASLVIMACLTTLITSIAEPTELFLTKLEARLWILGQMIVTWDLWARRDSWKFISLHLAGIIISLNMDTSVPNQAPHGFLLLSSAFLFIVILVVNTDKHLRSLSQPFPAPEEEYLYGIEWNKLPLFAPHLFGIIDMYDSDSSSGDEDFLDQQFDENIPVWATAG